MRARRIARFGSALLLGLLAACGGGGGGGSTPVDPGPSVVFLPSGSGGAGTVSLATASTSGANLTLQLQVSGVSDLYGLAFDLEFSPALLRFVSAAEGGHLGEDGTVETTFQVVESPEGNLVVGLSRLGDVPGVDGSGTLLRLTFQAIASGESSLRFVVPVAYDSAGEPISGTTWSGGTVRATL